MSNVFAFRKPPPGFITEYFGGGGKTSTSTQSVAIPPEVMARYNSVNAQAQDAAAAPFQEYGGEFVAPLNDTQNAGVAQTSQYAQSAQPYYNAATGYTAAGAQNVGSLTPEQIAYYQNPYTQSVIDPTVKAMQQQQGQQLSAQRGQQALSGAFGGDRSGIADAMLQGQQSLAQSQAISPLYAQAYNNAVQTATGQQGVRAQDLARQMQAGQQFAALGTGAQTAGLQGAQAMIGAGTLGQQTQQALDTAQYQQHLQEQGYPFQVAQFLAGIAMGTGALSGSTTTTTQPRGFFGNRGGFIDGPKINKAYGGGLMPSSMGGVVHEPGAFAGGGLVDSTDISALLAQQRGFLGPAQQGLGQGMPGAAGAVPQQQMHVPKLVTAGGLPKAPAGVGSDLGTAWDLVNKTADGMTGKSLERRGGEWAFGKDAVGPTFDANGKQLTAGQDATKGAISNLFSSNTNKDVPVEQSGIAMPVSTETPLPNYRGGLVRHHYDAGGDVEPYDLTTPTKGYVEPSVKEGDDEKNRSLAVAGKGPGAGPSGASELSSALGLGNAAMNFGSGVAGLFDAGPEVMAGLLSTGGVVPREHHGDNTTGDSNVAGGQNLGGADADPIEAMWPRLIKQESGGKQFDPETGKPLTSSAGAVGIAQVMPGTAPEAAKLAGLDYDEDRYRNDPEYNAALGKAYLKDQYRKFGDPQLAAAAYNAGPGAVQKAQQKAQESGQSIMSYLPQETQNYVASIFGGSPAGQAIQRAAPSPQGGMGAASPSGDTSQPGFFDNIGLNRQTLVPLLQGLAGMAGSKSRYLGSAILEGLGAGAKSYGEQQDQQAALLGKNIENVQNLYNNWRSVNYLNPMPFSQYAAAVGYKGPIPPSLMGGPFAGTAGAGAGSARPSIGSPAAIGTANVQDLISAYQNNAVTDYNGTKVSAQNDPVFLSRLRAALAPVASTDKIAAGMYTEAGNKLSEIKDRGNMTYDVSGQQVPVPGSLEAGTEAVGIAQSVKNYANEVGKSTAALQGLQQSQNVIDNMKDAYKNFQAGPGSAPLARTNALINTVNANFGTKIGSVGDKDAANPTAYYTALKEAANSVSSQFASVPGIAGAPKAGINLFESGTPNPDMAPGAIHHVMSQMEANVELANRWYSGLQDPEFRNKYGNINNYQKQFLSNPENQLSNIQQNKYDAIGPLKGEIPIIKTPEALSSVKGSNDFILGEGFDKSVQGENVKGMTARVVRNDEELRAAVNEAKRAQKKIAIIPTYGNMANQIGVVQ